MDADAAHGPSRHFDAAQQPRRFRSKADINFGASSYRVYEYTVWLSWPARIIPHTWEIRTRCSMRSRNFSRGFVMAPSQIELWQQFFSPISSTLQSRQQRWVAGNGVNCCSNTTSLCEGSWRGSVAGR